VKIVPPNIRARRNNTKKMKKRIFAIDAAPAAIPVNPKIAATTAIIRKIAVHLSITIDFRIYINSMKTIMP